MTTQYMSPPASGLNNSIIANGRSYSSAPRVPIDVQSADVALLTANGWSPYNTTLAHAWPGPTDSSIRQAALDMIVAGGGTIHLPVGFITLTAPLPLADCISYVGVPPTRTYTIDVADALWTFKGGTVLQGNGTFSAFVYNNTALGSPAATFDGLTGVAIKDIGFQNFYRGIDMGAANAGSLVWSTLENLAFTNIQDWGVSLINFFHVHVTRIYTQQCGLRSSSAALGIISGAQYYGQIYPSASCQLGNSFVRDLYNEGPSSGNFVRFLRGIVFEANGSTSLLNELHVDGVQSNKLTTSQLSDSAVVVTSGNTSLQVTDSTQWVVGMPFRFTTTANGFNLNQTYFVASIVDATHITVANSRLTYAAPISPTGSSTMTATSYGFPNLEICCVSGAAGVTNSRFEGIDVENITEIGVYCEFASPCVISINQVPVAGTPLVIRNCSLFAYSRNTVAYDCDANSSNNSRLDGARGLAHQRTMPGYGIDLSTGVAINFLNVRGKLTTGPDLTTNQPDFYINAGGLGIGTALGQAYQTRDTAEMLPFGDTYFNGSTGVTFTLPTIVTDTLYGSTHIGMPIAIYNFSANTIALATSSSQTFNNVASYTSHTIAAQTICKLKAAKLSSGTLIWAMSSESMVVSG